jgi:hypothetical protein
VPRTLLVIVSWRLELNTETALLEAPRHHRGG